MCECFYKCGFRLCTIKHTDNWTATRCLPSRRIPHVPCNLSKLLYVNSNTDTFRSLVSGSVSYIGNVLRGSAWTLLGGGLLRAGFTNEMRAEVIPGADEASFYGYLTALGRLKASSKIGFLYLFATIRRPELHCHQNRQVLPRGLPNP